MNTDYEGPAIGRILVTLDTSPESRALLDLSASLAACFEIPLTGLFIEDQDLLEFADMPIAREISMTGRGVRDLTRARIQAHFRSQAVAVRRALEVAAAQQRIECAFEIRRGRTDIEISAAAQETDLIAVCPGVGAVTRPRKYDYFGYFESSAASGVLMYRHRREGLRSDQVVAVDTGSPAAKEVVRLASRIAARSGDRFKIILVDNADDLTAERAGNTIPTDATDATIERMEITEGTPIAAHLVTVQPRLVVLPSDLSQRERQAISEGGLPVMVVRTSGG